MTDLSIASVTISLATVILTIIVYQMFHKTQQKLSIAWFNPMLLSIATIVPLLLYIDMPFEDYFKASQPLNGLLEPAVVALGFPLYQHLKTIRDQWRSILILLSVGAIIVICVSMVLTLVMMPLPEIAVSLSLKSITTPIAIALTEKLNGDSSITAFAIILAGLFGAFLGPRWLTFINVRSAQAQGLAIGAASHALGTATISKLSYQHAAYGSLALIFSAVVTAIISPALIPVLFSLLM